MACTQHQTCPLVRIFSGKPSLRIWSEWYCEGNYSSCARVRRASYGEPVPASLLPNGQTLDAPGEGDWRA